jgi:hypothetical protein
LLSSSHTGSKDANHAAPPSRVPRHSCCPRVLGSAAHASTYRVMQIERSV